VDDHNNLRHALQSIEDSWVTKRWEVRVFLFILAITEVNAFLAIRYFTFCNGDIDGCPTLLKFCRLLAWEMIRNRWIVEEERAEESLRVGDVYVLLTAPKHAGIALQQRLTSSTNVGYMTLKIAEIRSEPIGHVP
jgi:hypothetical protein